MEERIIKDVNNLLTQLFQKIKEEGYEWDAEKKEVKRVELKPTWWTKEDGRKIGTLSGIICDYAFLKNALDENSQLPTNEFVGLS